MGRTQRSLRPTKALPTREEIFNDHVLATAILNRPLHHCTTLNIEGESYRLKEKRKAGIFGVPPESLPIKEEDNA
jgi:DNA replication protein DnaC